ncbi:MAG: SNF2-related protein [Planctomycetota bacterium]
MQTLQEFMRSFPVTARVRGVSHFHGGRVVDVVRSEDAIRGSVKGTPPCSVELTRSPRRWKLVCSCPLGTAGELCEHGYAFLSEIVQRGGAKELSVHAKASDRDPALVQGWSAPARPSGPALMESLAELRFDPAPSMSKVKLLYVLSAGEPRSKLAEIEIMLAKKRSSWRVPEYQPMWVAPKLAELDEIDRRAVALIQGGSVIHDAHRGPRPLGKDMQHVLLEELGREKRLGYIAPRKRTIKPLALDEGATWSFEVSLERIGELLELDGWLARDGERIRLANVDLALAGDFAIAREQLVKVDWHSAFELALILVGTSPPRVSVDEANRIVAFLERCPIALPLHADEFVEVISGEATPVLELLPEQEARGQLPLSIRFEYGDKRIDRGDGTQERSDVRLVRIVRDRARESAALREFRAVGGELYEPRRRDVDGAVYSFQLASMVRDLSAQGWKVEGQGKRVSFAGVTSGSVSSGLDWFDLTARIDFDGVSADTGALVEALTAKSKLVRLSDGSLGVLPEEWLAQWGLLLRAGELEDGKLRFSQGRAFLLDALLAEQTKVTSDDQFDKWREGLAKAKRHDSMHETADFVGELRGYQREGLGWLEFLAAAGLGGCLADDMGLGKTIQVLAFALARKPDAKGPTLVVAPKTLLFNWESECKRFAPTLRVHIHHGNARARSVAPLQDTDLVVTTYGTMRLDIELLSKIEFDLAVLDEAQAIKNPASQAAKAARLLKARLRLALTGTPVENRLGDLLSIFDYLNPGMVEGSRALRSLGAEDDVDAARIAARALRPFMLRRTKEEVLRDLPPKTEQTLLVELEGTQKREYEKLRAHYQRTLLATVDDIGLDKARMNVLEALLRLRQVACHVGLIDDTRADEPCAKIETLLPLLEEVLSAGHKALVFSQFTSFLAILRADLDKRGIAYEYLDGQTRDRAARVTHFQEDAAVGLFLVSLKAGGVGLNLTAADYVFLLDPWWNPAVERQAVDRAHRIGQTRAVSAYRLVARDTVEEKVLALQDRKKALADALFAGEGRALRELTREDLEWVLS